MAINATDNGSKSVEPIKPGTHIARCVQMIHVGTLTEEIQGKQTTRNLVRMTFELPSEMHVFDETKGAEPRFVSKEFTLSLNEKSTLRKFLDTWRGTPFTPEEAKKFDVTRLLGVPCMLSIGLKTSASGRAYNSIDSALAVPNGIPAPDQITPSLEINFDNISENWEKIPGFLREKMITTPEFKSSGFNPPAEPINDGKSTETTQPTTEFAQPGEQPKKMPF
jgi:hypothetical protein